MSHNHPEQVEVSIHHLHAALFTPRIFPEPYERCCLRVLAGRIERTDRDPFYTYHATGRPGVRPTRPAVDRLRRKEKKAKNGAL